VTASTNGSPAPRTEKQRAVYALAVRYYRATGEPCSMSYLARQLHKHPSTIRAHVRALAKKGWVTAVSPPFQRVIG
jgi:DNA-binding MarR family transcriptional regulator